MTGVSIITLVFSQGDEWLYDMIESVNKKPIMSLAYGLTGNKTMTYKNLAGPLVFGQQWTGQPLNLWSLLLLQSCDKRSVGKNASKINPVKISED